LVESILIINYCWLVALTILTYRLYSRPISGIDPDDVDMIKEFMDRVRKIARVEKRKVKK
jgi:hypothetical protein